MSHYMDKQPAPKSNESKPIWNLVIEDMLARDKVGRERGMVLLYKLIMVGMLYRMPTKKRWICVSISGRLIMKGMVSDG